MSGCTLDRHSRMSPKRSAETWRIGLAGNQPHQTYQGVPYRALSALAEEHRQRNLQPAPGLCLFLTLLFARMTVHDSLRRMQRGLFSSNLSAPSRCSCKNLHLIQGWTTSSPKMSARKRMSLRVRDLRPQLRWLGSHVKTILSL